MDISLDNKNTTLEYYRDSLRNNITLLTLLRFAKDINVDNSNNEITWKSVKNVLEPIYSYDMKLKDVIYILYKTLADVKEIPEFKCNINEIDFILAPVNENYTHSSMTLDTTVKIEDFYNSIIRKIVYCYRYTNTLWCRDLLLEGFEYTSNTID